MKLQKQKTLGFTLVEILVYIAFFALLVGSLLAITFQTLESSSQISRKIVVQQEGNFILKKLEWALSGVDISMADPLPVPAINSGIGNSLTVYKYNFAQNPIRFSVGSGVLYVAKAGGLDVPLSSQNVSISSFQAEHKLQSGREWVEVNFVIDGQNFSITKYFRK